MSYLNSYDVLHVKGCACGNLRKTTRVITQFYDKILQPTGLRSTQFSLLTNILVHENISVSELGVKLLMDQTTVTRNIEILRKKGYITVTKEDDDSRRKSISITNDGEKKLEEAIPLWEVAQSKIEQGIGAENFQEFLKTLNYIQNLI
ncbi:MAG: MarR family winged helix-turn-helix transcriptional regulator [Clostridium sp.]|uniref:MarR family winged helix-turn-helix transcriptional regulator n=1 Tax=Clostridium sp. TaxID=1506 RepID=UPI0039E7445D